MIVYAIYCGGLRGSSYYRTHDEAQSAANFRTYCTGHRWEVKSVLIPLEQGA